MSYVTTMAKFLNKIESLQSLAGDVLADHIEYLIAPHLRKFVMKKFRYTQQYYKDCEQWLISHKVHHRSKPSICGVCSKLLVSKTLHCYRCRRNTCAVHCSYWDPHKGRSLCKKCILYLGRFKTIEK